MLLHFYKQSPLNLLNQKEKQFSVQMYEYITSANSRESLNFHFLTQVFQKLQAISDIVPSGFGESDNNYKQNCENLLVLFFISNCEIVIIP
jgi:hypothetical protein